jgi:hypothetical protein
VAPPIYPSHPLATDSRETPPLPTLRRPVRLSFEYAAKTGAEFCLCHMKKDELKDVADCLRQLTTMPWQDVWRSGGKPGTKTGLGYTVYDDGDLRHVTRPQRLDPAIRIFGVRLSRRGMVFGAYTKEHWVYILWFDREHKIVPG